MSLALRSGVRGFFPFLLCKTQKKKFCAPSLSVASTFTSALGLKFFSTPSCEKKSEKRMSRQLQRASSRPVERGLEGGRGSARTSAHNTGLTLVMVGVEGATVPEIFQPETVVEDLISKVPSLAWGVPLMSVRVSREIVIVFVLVVVAVATLLRGGRGRVRRSARVPNA